MQPLISGSPEGESFDPALVEVARSLARHFGADAQDAEDVAQEALLKFLTHRATILDPIAWLYVVVRRLHQRRARSRHDPLPVSFLAVDPWPELELRLDARRLLARIPSRGRASIYLSLAGYSERETASRLGCSVKAMEKSLHLARRRMRQLSRE